MPASPLDMPRTFGVEADRFREAEFCLRRLCDRIAAEVRGSIVGGVMEFRFPCSKEVCNGSRIGSITDSSISSGADAMTICFISVEFWRAISEVG